MSSVQVSGHLPRHRVRDGVETNLRVVEALNGHLECDPVRFESADCGSDIREKICSRLRRLGRVAVPSPIDAHELLLVPGQSSLPDEVEGDGWHAKLFRKVGVVELNLANRKQSRAAEAIIQKSLVVEFEKSTSHWCLSESTRYWYTDEPVAVEDGVVLLPRLSFATHGLGDSKIGISFDCGHMIRSEQCVADYLASPTEREVFERFRCRDKGRKGTLIYNTGGSRRSKCYFHSYADGLTCETTGVLKFGNERHESLFEYYRQRYPKLAVSGDDPVVYVSFDWGDRPVLVNAKLLHLRLRLDAEQMPAKLRRLSMSPSRRREQVMQQWTPTNEAAVEQCGVKFCGELWQPDVADTEQLPAPDLLFGQGERLRGPQAESLEDHQKYFRKRQRLLREHGAYRVEATVAKDIWIVTPPMRGHWSQSLQDAFVNQVRQNLDQLTRQTFRLRVTTATSARDAAERLQKEPTSTSLIVFDEQDMDGAAYYLLAEELPRWRLKRVTRSTLEGAWRRWQRASNGKEKAKAERAWNDVIFHTVLDLLDQMEVVPWRIASWEYDACLAIDVAQERRFCAVTLLLCRDPEQYAGCNGFWRYIETWAKTDTRRETINPVRLEDKIAGIVEQFSGSHLSQIRSVLVLRDGRECGDEPQAIDRGLNRWKQRGVLAQSAAIDVVDYHKHTVKDLRMWNCSNGDVTNVLGGRAIYLQNAALVCLTGAATVSKYATSDPCLLVGRENADVRRAARAVFALAQHNYLSPNTAYRDAQPMRDADHALMRRSAIEVRGLR